MRIACAQPLQGAVNAVVYGWSLPSIREIYRSQLLGSDGLDAVQVGHDDHVQPYLPPTFHREARKEECGSVGSSDSDYSRSSSCGVGGERSPLFAQRSAHQP